MWDKENECPENCTCNCCADVEEEKFEVRENLTDEEIEEIIEREYKDKNSREKYIIRKGLKKFGDKFTYYKVKCDESKNTVDIRYIPVTITCRNCGDFTVKFSKFFDVGCPIEYISIEENFNNTFKHFKYKDLPKTKEYLREQFSTDNLIMNLTAILAKEDFINIAKEIRDDLDLFDFSEIPNIILGINFKLSIKYTSIKDGTIKIWETDLNHFIDRKQIPTELSHYKNWELRYSKNNYEESVKTRLEEKYPTMDFSDFEYKAMKSPIKGICKIHGEIVYYHTVDSLLRDGSEYICPECMKEHKHVLSEMGVFSKKDTEMFIKECEELYGRGMFDYSLVNYVRYDKPVTIIDLEDNDVFEVEPRNFLRGCGNPNKKHMSCGETFVFSSLRDIKENYIPNMEIKSEVYKKDIIEGRTTNTVKIDFICYIDSKEIWIEYNGEQHYNPGFYKNTKAEDMWETYYRNQLKRDKNVKNYCIENNIPLIIIPYTYYNLKSVYNILYNILVDGKDQNEVITLPEIEEI